MSTAVILSGKVVPCEATDHVGWLVLRLQLWPDGSPEVFMPEMAAACAAPDRFAQFLFLSEAGSPEGFIEVALRPWVCRSRRTLGNT
jgi:hypothetical protein